MHTELSPFKDLLKQEAAIKAFAQGMPHIKKHPQTWLGIKFLTGNYVLLAGLNEVVEILQVPSLATIPGVKPWLRGMGFSRQEIFPVSDLSHFIMGKPTHMTKHARVVMMHYHEGYCGLLVDKVFGLQRILLENMIEKKTADPRSSFDPYMIGAFTDKHIELPIISLTAIIREPRFRDAALKNQPQAEMRE